MRPNRAIFTMAQDQSGPAPVHCYTNPSFCRQSEYIPEYQGNDLPPPPQQFQTINDLPPPPPTPSPPIEPLIVGGRSNPGFQGQLERPDRYGYLDETSIVNHRRYGSVPADERRRYHRPANRYEYIEDEPRPQLQRANSSRYDFLPQQQTQQQHQLQQQQLYGRSASAVNHDENRPRAQPSRGRYAVVPGEQDDLDDNDDAWNGTKTHEPSKRQINTPQGRYNRVPLQEEDPPILPDRNFPELSVSSRNNLATQKLHEILTTPRKSRSRSEERALSPKSQYGGSQAGTPQRRAQTPGASPTGRTFSPTRSTQGTPQNRPFVASGPKTSTPNKEPAARRCLPLTDKSRQQDTCPATNCGRMRYVTTSPVDLVSLGEQTARYAYTDNGPESLPMVAGSPRYQIVSASHKRGYHTAESAFIARTAVVPPLSPPTSEANTTLTSAIEKGDRRNAPLLLVLVGILTCGLGLYLSWTQGRRYYFDSAVGCGACCALAGACRSLRRTWTGLGLAGLAALSCAGMLLLAAKSPRPGTPLHDVTAGALCGVSLLGAALALLALLAPRCNFGRHRRVHSWMPRFSP